MATLSQETAREVARGLAQAALEAAALYPEAEAASFEPAQRDRTEAEDAGIRSKGGHSDPTADRALAIAGQRRRLDVAGRHLVAALQEADTAVALLRGLAE